MRSFPIIVIIFLGAYSAFSQDTAKINNALLLDYYQNQRFDQAADYLKKTYPEPVKDLKILKALAYCTQMQGKLPQAESYYLRIYQLDSTGTGVLFNLGSINLRRGNPKKAEIWYKKIIAMDSTNFIVCKQLARINADKRDTLTEISYLIKASSLNSGDADVASDLSDLFVAFKNYSPAEKILSVAIKADTENVVLLESLVKLEYNQKKWRQTTETGKKLIQSGDMSNSILTEIGIAFYNMGDYLSSINAFNKIDEMGQNETTCYFTGACYKKLKDYDKALFYFKKTINKGISPDINTYYTEIADTYETIKQYKKAVIAYQKALQFDQTAITYYAIANLYDTELKKRKLALIYYKKYLKAKLKPGETTYIAYA